MSYDNIKLEYSKEKITIVEIELDTCSLSSGVSPCAATQTGDNKCFNTFASCNDLPSYAKTTKTYRFCTGRSPHPIGLDAIPSLLSASISPAKIDLSGGLGTRASVSLTFKDHPSSDINIDKYVGDRSYIAFERGTYWTKLRARNANYENRPLRVLSGYLVDGKYDQANFTTRYYIIDKMDVTSGQARITAKDPLKLAGMKKAQAPKASTGQLLTALTSTATSATLTPTGVGNLEYPLTGKVLINSEVLGFIRSGDTLTLTRAQYNTTAKEHSENDTVQLCLEYSGKQVDFIVKDLLTNYANIDSSFISDTAWSAEVDTFLNGLLSGIIVKPFDVFKLLKELAESMPHYLWWDERAQLIQLTALKAPPTGADVLDMEENIIENSFSTIDKTDLRVSTVFVNFGQFDPTKKIDEFSNYQQSYARIDTDSIAKYGSSEIKTVNSRWISNTNKAAALQLAALIGRRFSDVPREVAFSLEAKDSDVWVGQSREVNHRDIADFTGAPINTTFQLLSAREGQNYDYKAIEYTYGDSLPEDEGGGNPDVDLILLGSNQHDLNIRDQYNLLFPAPSSSTQVKVIVEPGVIIGATTIANFALDTGNWPTGATITLQLDIGAYIVGKGGDGADIGPANGSGIDGGDGGGAMVLNHPMTLVNNGIIGGGGGGGGSTGVLVAGQGIVIGGGGGGGGAGYDVGLGGAGIGQNGTTETGGTGGAIANPAIYGGSGGDLGQDGTVGVSSLPVGAKGLAGAAIDKNGYTLTQTVTGDIRGIVIT